MLIGTRRGHREVDPAYADLDQRTDLQQVQPDSAATGPGELGEGQTDAAKRTEQHIGKRGEPQAQLIGPHGGGRGALSEQVQLAFLDPVLHLAPRTVDPLIQLSGVDLGGWQPPRSTPDSCMSGSTVRGARWRTGSRNASWTCSLSAPRPPPCGPISCACGSPRLPMCCSVRFAASVWPSPSSPGPVAALSG